VGVAWAWRWSWVRAGAYGKRLRLRWRAHPTGPSRRLPSSPPSLSHTHMGPGLHANAHVLPEWPPPRVRISSIGAGEGAARPPMGPPSFTPSHLGVRAAMSRPTSAARASPTPACPETCEPRGSLPPTPVPIAARLSPDRSLAFNVTRAASRTGIAEHLKAGGYATHFVGKGSGLCTARNAAAFPPPQASNGWAPI
jgi:hypothetical protein